MNNIEQYKEKTFEDIKHIDDNGNEYWKARELQQILGYKEWRYFSAVIEKAQVACSQSNNNINSNFGVNTKIVSAGKTTKPIIDYKLSRYACYLIVQNANPKYEAVALGQTYFAVQTRKMELTEEEYNNLTEDEKRLYRRKQTRDGNKILYKIAKEKDFELLVGSDSKITYAYNLGATAAVAGTSNVIVDTLVGLDRALRLGDEEQAIQLQKDIDVLRGVLKLGTVPSVIKRSCELANIAKVGPARLPVQELSQEDDKKILEMLNYYHLV